MCDPTQRRTGNPEFVFKSKFFVSLTACGLIFFFAGFARAGSATWDLNPVSADWNTAASWMPATVPNGPTDTATFDLSNTTNVSISSNTEVNAIVFDGGASAFTITARPNVSLTISGAGITNNSGITQKFVTPVDGAGNTGAIFFTNSATAGSSTLFTNQGVVNLGEAGGLTHFSDTSSAGSGTFINNSGRGNVVGLGGGRTEFHGSSTAANGTFLNKAGTVADESGGTIQFRDTSTAGNGTFTNEGGAADFALGGGINFFDHSTAGTATITNNGGAAVENTAALTSFNNSSTAANGTFINNGGAVAGAFGGETVFFHSSTAANGTFINNGGAVAGAFGGHTGFTGFFGETPTAGNGTFINNGAAVAGAFGGVTTFEFSFADSATLIANGGTNGGAGGQILFGLGSFGGTARVEVFGNGNLDIGRGSNTIGSIEGDGNVFLGGNTLTVGSNNMDTTFSGVIQDSGAGGSLTKIGTGTLILSGANTYIGNTNVNRGVLQVDGSITSNTFVNHKGTLAGIGTLQGDVTNAGGTVSPGDPLGSLTVTGNYTQQASSTLLIDIAGLGADQFSLLNVLGAAELDGRLNPVLLNGFIPAVGDSFTFLNYASVTGSLVIQHPIIDGAMEHWSVTYFPNHAVLTVAAGVPDEAATLLLMTLSLVALLGLRANLRHS